MHIQSVMNPRVKQWASLLTKKGRKNDNQFIVEGVSSVVEAITAKARIDCVVYEAERGLPDELQGKLGEIPVISVSEAVLKKCTDAVTPQPVMAIVHQFSYSLTSIMPKNEHPSHVILCDSVQDPGNVGTIIRSADAAGAAGVIVGPNSADVFQPKVVRATMGSLFHLPIITCDLEEAILKARAHDIQVWSTHPHAPTSCYDAKLGDSAWFVIGNEARGVSPEIEAIVTDHLYIPMQGKAESLNAAMAATILLFEAKRQQLG